MTTEKSFLIVAVLLVSLGLNLSAGGQDKPPGRSLPIGGRIILLGKIVNKASGRCLDVYRSSRENEAKVQQYDCNDGQNQIWGFVSRGRSEYVIINKNSAKVLDVYQASTDNSARVQQYQWNEGANQRWRLEAAPEGFYRIVNVLSRKCLDVENDSMQNEANVIQYDCGNGDNQLWRVGQR